MATERRELISRAVGAELRRAREAAGLSRGQLSKQLGDIEQRTIASWELGRRRCPIDRVAEVCWVLNVSVSELVQLALQRIGWQPASLNLLVDLPALRDDRDPRFAAIRGWARSKLDAGTTVARIETTIVHEIAVFVDVARDDVATYLAQFAPSSIPRGRPSHDASSSITVNTT